MMRRQLENEIRETITPEFELENGFQELDKADTGKIFLPPRTELLTKNCLVANIVVW